jgi:hypothetical protein
MLKITYAVILLFLLAGNAVGETWTWIPVETVEVDWNADGKKDRVVLEAIKEIVETHDPGDFHRVRIQIAGKPEFVLENSEGWVRYNGEASVPEKTLLFFVDKAVGLFKYQASSGNRYKSVARSDYFALSPASPSRNKEYIMLLFGYQYASSPGKLTVISLDHTGYPRVIFDEEFELSRLEVLDGDNLVELIGEPRYGEVFGPDNIFHSYVPTYIYSLVRKDGYLQLQMSRKLSKKYNEEHYYGWVDPEASHEYVVVEPKDGSSPKLMKLTDAEKTYGRPGMK